MRLAIAAGILSQTLPVSSKSRISGFGDPVENRRKAQELRLQAQASGRDVSNAQKGSELDHSFQGFLAKIAEKHIAEVKNNVALEEKTACDPNSEDADVGILSCGEGKYCKESETSELGGLCMNEDSGRGLQTGIGYSAHYLFCNSSSPYYGGNNPYNISCNCTQLDLATNTGYVYCVAEDYCFNENCTISGTVYSAAYNYGPNNHTELTCLYFEQPYEQSVCYVFSYLNGNGYPLLCAINDELCNYCLPTFDAYLNVCTQFNCTNTCGMHSGDTCDGGYVAPILLPDVSGTCNPDAGTPEPTTEEPTEGEVSDPPTMADMVTEAPVMATAAPVDMTTTEAPVEMTTTEAPVEMPPAPTPAPVGGGEPPVTSAPVAGATESPTEAPSGGLSLLTQKTAVSLFGLSMGLLAYFAA